MGPEASEGYFTVTSRGGQRVQDLEKALGDGESRVKGDRASISCAS